MKIISWNVNSVRARIDNITNYIKDDKPDMIEMEADLTVGKKFLNQTTFWSGSGQTKF